MWTSVKVALLQWAEPITILYPGLLACMSLLVFALWQIPSWPGSARWWALSLCPLESPVAPLVWGEWEGPTNALGMRYLSSSSTEHLISSQPIYRLSYNLLLGRLSLWSIAYLPAPLSTCPSPPHTNYIQHSTMYSCTSACHACETHACLFPWTS